MKAKPSSHSGEVILEVNRRDEEMLSRAVFSPLRIKQILVPVDFSDCSRKALQYALPLAKQHKAAITLVHVVPAISAAFGEYGAFDAAAITKDMRESAERELAKLLVDEIRGVVAADTLVRVGSPVAEIVHIAKDLPADMIVISTHGRGGLKHVLLGSVAERVVRHALVRCWSCASMSVTLCNSSGQSRSVRSRRWMRYLRGAVNMTRCCSCERSSPS